MAHSTKKTGFTLVELMVVISIIGTLVALLLPAISVALGQAYLTECINNQKEIAFAIQSYETAKGKYPASYSHPRNNLTVVWTWVPPLMPHLDHQDYSDKLFTDPDLSKIPLYEKMLVCPSANRDNTPFQLTYTPNMGKLDSASGTTPADKSFNGIFHDHRGKSLATPVAITEMTAGQIKDGLSTTILLSENLDATRWNETTSASWTDVREFATGILWDPTDPGTGLNRNIGVTDAAHARPSSFHPGGFVVAMCDGSTKFISEEISYEVYSRLMTPNGTKTGIAAQAVPLSDSDISQ